MAKTYYFSAPSKLLNNFTDEEELGLNIEDMNALDDAQEYSYFFSTSNGQQELQF